MDTSNNKEEGVSMLQENRKPVAFEQESPKFQQYFCTITASMGALIIGCVLAWTSPALDVLAKPSSPLHISRQDESWIAAWTPIGAVLGALPAGFIANRVGRKSTLIIFTIPFIGTWIVTLYTHNVILLFGARFIKGIILGLFCAVLPMYVNEIAEDSIRGLLGTFFQVFLTLGILLDYILGTFENYSILNYTCLGVTILFFFMLFLIPESPVYLLTKNRLNEAENALRQLRGRNYDVNTALNQLRKPIEAAANHRISFSAVNIKALIISVGLMMGQQLSGINGVIFFAARIFYLADAASPQVCTVFLGIVQTLATVVSSILVEKAGRRLLLVISGVGMAISLLTLGYYFHLRKSHVDVSHIGWLPLASMVGFIIAFSLGFGPLPWMMGGEVMAPEIKCFGTAMSVAVNWTCVSVVTFFFQPLSQWLSVAYTFWMFSIICLLSTLFVILVVPETKGKSLQQIQDELAGVESNRSINNSEF